MSKKLTANEIAEKVELGARRIRKMIADGEIRAKKFGRDWVIDAKYIEIIKNRPERRGRKPSHKAA